MASVPTLHAKDDIEDVMRQLKDEANADSSDEEADEYVPSEQSLQSDGEDDDDIADGDLTNSSNASGEEFSDDDDDDVVETDEVAAQIARERGETSEAANGSEESDDEDESDELRRTDSISTTADTECDWKEESQDSASMREIPRTGRQMLKLQRAVDGKAKKPGNGTLENVSCFVMYRGIVCSSKRGITSEHVAKISGIKGCPKTESVIFCVPVTTEKHGLVYAELTSSEELAAIRESFRTKGLKRAAQMRTLVNAQSKADTHGVFDLVRKLDVKGFGPYVDENGNERATIVSHRLKVSRNTVSADVAMDEKKGSPKGKVYPDQTGTEQAAAEAAPAPMDVEVVHNSAMSPMSIKVSTPPKKRPMKMSDGVVHARGMKPPRKESRKSKESKKLPVEHLVNAKKEDQRSSRKRKDALTTQRGDSQVLSSISEEGPVQELHMKEVVSAADVTVTSKVKRHEHAIESPFKRRKMDNDHIQVSFTITLPKMSSALSSFLLNACKSTE